MEPQIDYATAADGVRIATLSLGNQAGPPLLIAATPPWSHVLLEYRIPPVRAWMDSVGETARVVRYDCRGTGFSDRGALDFSVDAQVRDMEAVADHYGLKRFALWGSIGGSPASIAYAARHPERVSQLFLWCGYARGAAVFGRSESRALGALLGRDWGMYTDTYAQAAFGWPDSDTAAQYAALTREAITQEGMVAFVRAMSNVDVTDEARRVSAPTLVMTRRDSRFSGPDEARELASFIPGARLLVFEGSSPAPFLGDTAPVLAAIRDFPAAPASAARSKRAAPPLTLREQQVLRLLASGRSGKEIAADLEISLATAQRHIANIYTKIGARGRVAAVAYAFEHGMARVSED
jgi:pimeloyl-ACP methyl ester carboxylesterase/DNA-binding CsgD family transcriptional regulator